MKEVKEVVKLNVKGQITIPNSIRKFYLKGSRFIGFRLTPNGILLVPLEMQEKTPYTAQEWNRIEELASRKGQIKKGAKAAKAHIDSL